MKTISLEQFALCLDTIEKGWQQCNMTLLGKRFIGAQELFRISHAVIGRQVYAHQQYTCSTVLNEEDHRIQIMLHRSQGQSSQAVVCAQFQNDDCGFLLYQRGRQACQTPGAGFAADTGIDHAPVLFVMVKTLLQQTGPGLAGFETIARR